MITAKVVVHNNCYRIHLRRTLCQHLDLHPGDSVILRANTPGALEVTNARAWVRQINATGRKP